jgi:hypothetical protein
MIYYILNASIEEIIILHKLCNLKIGMILLKEMIKKKQVKLVNKINCYLLI